MLLLLSLFVLAGFLTGAAIPFLIYRLTSRVERGGSK